MKWLDYFFYRLYLHFVKKDVPPVFGASAVFAFNICSFTFVIWVPLLRYFFPNIGNMAYYIPMVITTFLVWSWYRKRITKILEEYKKTELKSNILVLVLIIMTGINAVIGAIINIYVWNYLESKDIFLP